MFDAIKTVDCPAWVIAGYHLKGYFKTKRHWDQDNLVSSNKARIDGIADAAGQDDRTFRCLGVETFTDKERPRLEILLEIVELI